MNMPRLRAEAIRTANAAVVATALALEGSNDPDAMLRTLDELWSAARRARETITDARDATRAEALQEQAA